MAIYKDNDTFYLYALPINEKVSRRIRTYVFSGPRLSILVRVYTYCLLVTALIFPLSAWFGLVQKALGDPPSFLLIAALTSVNALTILLIVALTFMLKTSTSVVDIGQATLVETPSHIIYGYFLMFSMNAAMLLMGADWGDGWETPSEIGVLIVAFCLASIGAAYRLASSLMLSARKRQNV